MIKTKPQNEVKDEVTMICHLFWIGNRERIRRWRRKRRRRQKRKRSIGDGNEWENGVLIHIIYIIHVFEMRNEVTCWRRPTDRELKIKNRHQKQPTVLEEVRSPVIIVKLQQSCRINHDDHGASKFNSNTTHSSISGLPLRPRRIRLIWYQWCWSAKIDQTTDSRMGRSTFATPWIFVEYILRDWGRLEPSWRFHPIFQKICPTFAHSYFNRPQRSCPYRQERLVVSEYCL